MLTALSPLDGRYADKTLELSAYFSEAALMEARIIVELEYFLALAHEPKLKEFSKVTKVQEKEIIKLVDAFDVEQAELVKGYEAETNHDVKAVEYYLKKKLAKIPNLKQHLEFVHFCLTSEDVNNLAYGIMIHDGLKDVILLALKTLIADLTQLAKRSRGVRMLSLTHGQPATPTTLGKECWVFIERLNRQYAQLKKFKMQGKFGGAVGNYAAHKCACPDVNWEAFGRKFVRSLGLEPLRHTTQINPHDDLAELSHIMHRINAILLDFSRDVWLYILRGVFKQAVVEGEVGSSTMPHKINPIDFENAEGNLGLSSALFTHFADKLPISRLQRDLSDSTVQRNVGSAFGYHLLAVESLRKGLAKLSLDHDVLQSELEAHPEVLAEAIQVIMRRKGVKGAYEHLKKATRGQQVTLEELVEFMGAEGFSEAEVHSVVSLLRS